MIRLRLLGQTDLRDELNGELRRVLAQPKRLALLAYLALANGQFRRRDNLLALFWPELDAQRARAALRQALHHLRRELGADAILARGGEDLGIDGALVWCDVTAFRERLAAGDDEGALGFYGGDLLAGVFFADAPAEWDSWLEAERLRLKTAAAAAAWRLSDRAQGEDHHARARAWAQRAFEIVNDEAAFREFAIRIARTGDTVGLRRAYDVFARRLQREFEIEPSEETRALVAHLVATSHSGAPLPSLHRDGVAVPAAPVRKRRQVWRYAAAALVVLGAALSTVAWWRSGAETRPRVLAVGSIRDMAQSPTVAAALSELMTTELSRAAGARVISSSRLYEVALQLDSAAPLSALARAASSAGADEYVEGALYGTAGEMRLDLRRVELATGRVLAAFSVAGPDAYTLTERATGRLLGDLGLQPASGSLADVTTRSVVALRFYQEGLRARIAEDYDAARRFLAAAVAEDSLFAMAAFELARLHEDSALTQRAARLALRASDRERLIIQARHAHDQDSPARLAIAETLAVRYPTEPEGLVLLGRAQKANAQFLESARTFRRVIAMDSISLRGNQPQCRACEAYGELVGSLIYADSMRSAEAVAREYARRVPQREEPWMWLATVLEHAEKLDEALDALAMQEQRNGRSLGQYTARTEFLIKQGRLGEAEAFIRTVRSSAVEPSERRNAMWVEWILLRNMGRFREALKLADELRNFDPAKPRGERYWTAVARQITLFDLGRTREAWALADSAAMFPFGHVPSRQARSIIGQLTAQVNLAALHNDSARLRVLADSIARMAPHSGYTRDRRLAHYARGVLYRVQGKHQQAVRELEQSLYSPLGGYVRANLELGRELLAVGRARDAFYVLDAGMRGPVGASGLYSIQPELRTWRARAREAMGDRAGALADYERVVRDLSRADPEAHVWRNFAAARIRALQPRRG